ncbi:conserved Plasmodium protein, unknown function [Babesia microti strain RI]|uniref:Uncharacterized protein n=1 Tax=Babesia microti (strain RI) TaxID=1133968 RepID=A0A1R4ABT3_BABMR|nr:conserved Plasmodium protein, unknown function [Babesia microti strain RI]SJK86472.1 conserved Plasmodium protein, unknown function [Babesia microti strain RI]|eukprot:XP_021338629.1 conserved Plasmodium protein, unknown function [Babesia microti strain RI]
MDSSEPVLSYKPLLYFPVDITEKFPLKGTPTSLHVVEDNCISTNNRGELRYMNLSKCTTTLRAKISQRGISNSCLEDSNKFIYSITYNSKLLINSLQNVKRCYELKNLHDGYTLAVSTPPGMNYLIYTGGSDGLVKVWDIRMLRNSNFPVKIISNHKSSVSSIAFRDPTAATYCPQKYNYVDLNNRDFPDIYCTASYDGFIRVLDVPSNQVLMSYQDVDKLLCHCEFTFNGNYILSMNLHGKAMRHLMLNPPISAKLPKIQSLNKGIHSWNSHNFPAVSLPLVDKENVQINHGRIVTRVTKFEEYKSRDVELLDLYCSDSLYGLEDNLLERGTITFRSCSDSGKIFFPMLNGTIQVHDICTMQILSIIGMPMKLVEASNTPIFCCVKTYPQSKLVIAAITAPKGEMMVFTEDYDTCNNLEVSL